MVMITQAELARRVDVKLDTIHQIRWRQEHGDGGNSKLPPMPDPDGWNSSGHPEWEEATLLDWWTEREAAK